MFETNNTWDYNNPTAFHGLSDEEIKKMHEAIKREAKSRADMKAAIMAAPTYNIRSQLRYRFKNKLYEYADLVDPAEVQKFIDRQIPKPTNTDLEYTDVIFAPPSIRTIVNEDGSMTKEITV